MLIGLSEVLIKNNINENKSKFYDDKKDPY
jgi:hypothetical protein